MTGIETFAGTALSFGAATTLRASALLTGGFALAWVARRSGASARHGVWSVTFAALLFLPLLAGVVPSLSVRLPTIGHRDVAATRVLDEPATLVVGPERAPANGIAASEPDPDVAAAQRTRAEPVASRGVSLGEAIALLWLAGALAGIGALALGLRRAGRASRRAEPVLDPGWQAALHRAARRLGVRRPVALRFSAAVGTPLTGGVLRPFVLLPAAARAWSEERRDLVLAHELIHVARGDVLRQLVTRLAACLYWFHPLLWWATRDAALAREEACDEQVLRLGLRPSAYARHLLDLAEPELLPLPALAHIERPNLEKRVMAILNPARARPRWLAAMVTATAAVWALSVAAASPAAEPLPAQAQDDDPAEVGSRPAASDRGATPSASTSPSPLPEPSVPPPVQAVVQERTCWVDGLHGEFSGTLSQRTDATGNRTYERYGFSGDDRVVQTNVGDMTLCLRARGSVDFSDDMTAVTFGEGGSLLLGMRDAHGTQQLEQTAAAGGVETTWTVDGDVRPFDADAERWRAAMLEMIGTRWQISSIRGRESSLRGDISSVRGRESSLRGEISSIRGHVSSLRGRISSIRGRESSLRGEISSIRGRESSMRGEISSIRGRESSMRGEISSLRGRISSLAGAQRSTRDEETRRRLEAEAETVRARILEVERRIAAYDADARIAEVERRIAEYDTEARVREVEERRQDYDVDARVREIEQEIAEYDADARVREVEERIRDLDVDGRVAETEERLRELDADRRVSEIESRLPAAERRLETAVRAVR